MTDGAPRAPQATEVVTTLAAALTARSLYPAAHPRVREAVGAAVTTCGGFLSARGSVELPVLRVGADLAVAGEPLLIGSIVSRGLHAALARHGIEGITVLRGLEAEELAAFLDALCEGRGARSTPHLLVGEVTAETVRPGDEPSAAASPALDLAASLSHETLGRAATAWSAIGRGEGDSGALEAVERLASDALDLLAVVSERLLPLSPAPGEEDELFQHSLRVCLLSLALARALGFRGEPLRELGVAAMLHDVGRLALPPELREARGRLDDRSWRLMQLHPELGAARLGGVEGAPTLSVLVAYEHHLRPDGSPGGYPEAAVGRRPTLASQVVAVADRFDVFWQAVAGQGRAGLPAALEILAARGAAGELRPELVGRFAELVAVDGD